MVRPLVQMIGNHDFNEIFFEDVVVPKRSSRIDVLAIASSHAVHCERKR